MARILIADDRARMREVLKQCLEMHSGWKICGEAVDGREAVSKAVELKPDIVILDFAMPDINGLRAAHEIREVMPTTPILLYTLFKSPALEADARKVGIRNVIGKEAGLRRLFTAIEAELKAIN